MQQVVEFIMHRGAQLAISSSIFSNGFQPLSETFHVFLMQQYKVRNRLGSAFFPHEQGTPYSISGYAEQVTEYDFQHFDLRHLSRLAKGLKSFGCDVEIIYVEYIVKGRLE